MQCRGQATKSTAAAVVAARMEGKGKIDIIMISNYYYYWLNTPKKRARELANKRAKIMNSSSRLFINSPLPRLVSACLARARVELDGSNYTNNNNEEHCLWPARRHCMQIGACMFWEKKNVLV